MPKPEVEVKQDDKFETTDALNIHEFEKKLDQTKKTEEKRIARVVSWRDPLLTHIRREMYANYGDAWTHPIVSGGMVAGYMEAWAMSGLLDVREVVLDENMEIE